MAGYLDSYGVADQRRERIVKLSLIIGIGAIVLGAAAYFSFRTRSQEQVMNQFLDDLKHQQYMDAYKLWGCPEHCKLYPQAEFLKDFGPSGKWSKPDAFKIEHVDYCGDDVAFDLSYPQDDDLGLWVNRKTNFVTFSPRDDTPRCPGPHVQIGAFFKSLFS